MRRDLRPDEQGHQPKTLSLFESAKGDIGVAGAALKAFRGGEDSELADVGSMLEAEFMLRVIRFLTAKGG